MDRKRKPSDAVGKAPLVARLLRSEPADPRRERLLAVQLGFEAVNDLDHVAIAVAHARSTIQKWFDAYRLGGVVWAGSKLCSRTAGPTSKVGPTASAPRHGRRWRKGSK